MTDPPGAHASSCTSGCPELRNTCPGYLPVGAPPASVPLIAGLPCRICAPECSEEHADCCGGACSQKPSVRYGERRFKHHLYLSPTIKCLKWSWAVSFLESLSHTPQASGVYTSSCFHVVCVCTWWVRIGFAGCASPNVVSGQAGPIATHWARPWTLQKSPASQKPSGVLRASLI